MDEAQKKAFLKQFYGTGGSVLKAALGENDEEKKKIERKKNHVDKSELLALSKIFAKKDD